jgi:hypothetical protein
VSPAKIDDIMQSIKIVLSLPDAGDKPDRTRILVYYMLAVDSPRLDIRVEFENNLQNWKLEALFPKLEGSRVRDGT